MYSNEFICWELSSIWFIKGGSIPYVAREVFDKITSEQQMIEVPVENTSTMLEAIKAYGKGIASFAGLDSALTLLTLKDPAISNPSFHKRKSISIIPYTGKVVITPEVFMDHIESYKPDLFHIMSDGETIETCAQKRLINANERTLYFVDECLELYRNNASLADSCLIGSWLINHCLVLMNVLMQFAYSTCHRRIQSNLSRRIHQSPEFEGVTRIDRRLFPRWIPQ